MLNIRECSICGQSHWDRTPSYCRRCTNRYSAWRHRQKRKGLPTTVVEYREQLFQGPQLPAESEEVPTEPKLRECSVCFDVHRNLNSGSYCAPCQSAYNQWSRLRKGTRRPDDEGYLTATMEEFRAAVDSGRVVPRKPGHVGKVVRSI